jgi:exopolysaccharide biosynthesis polyprenyl glycosylphosphotransferase
MKVTERDAVVEGVSLHDDLTAALNERTLQILDRRRQTAVIRRRGWLIRRMLVLADLIGLSLAFLLAEQLAQTRIGVGHVDPIHEYLVFVFTLPAWILITKLHGLYDYDQERTGHDTVDDIPHIFHVVTVGVFLLFVTAWATRIASPDPGKLVVFWGLAIVLVAVARVVARGLSRHRITYLQNTIIVGAGKVGQLIAHKFLYHSEYGINLVGFVDARPRELHSGLEKLPVLGPPERLPAIVRLFDIERVVIAFASSSNEETLKLIRTLQNLNVQVDIVPRLFEVIGSRISVHAVEGVPLVGLLPPRLSPSDRFLKRTMDIFLAAVLLIILLPLLVVVAVAIKLDSPGPAFFRQVRAGIDGKSFRILKLRTMAVGADEQRSALRHLSAGADNGDQGLFKLEADPRVTRLGRYLRRSSIDEVPQLINVLGGTMSLVGPRPLPLDEDLNVTDWGRRRLALKPGITGLWQVLGRSDIPFGEMITLDYLYVTSWSLFNDCKLVARTIPALFRARGAY